MQLNDFPGCCGAGVILALDNQYFIQRNLGVQPPENDFNLVLTELKMYIKTAKIRRWGLLTATTNPQQTKVEELLTKLGFKVLHPFVNPNHNNSELKLWGLDLPGVDVTALEQVTLG